MEAPAGSAPKKKTFTRSERVLLVAIALWVAVMGVGVGSWIYVRKMAAAPQESALPKLYPVPPFTFTDQNGQPFSSESLKGKVWVANFIFTRCPTICPMFTAKMASVQKSVLPYKDQVHLISFTVDPAYDTPAVLKAYAEQHHANPELWTFLTGTREGLQKTIVGDLKINMGEESDNLMAIAHGGHFVLVDQEMNVRGYYNSEDEDAVERLVADAAGLIR